MDGIIRFGVWGVGRMGIIHGECFSRQTHRYRAVAFCDAAPERAQAAAAQYGGRGYGDIEAFLADPETDLVIIATRSLDHAKHAGMALAAGKRVLLEKPIGVTHADYLELKKLVKKYPDRLFFGQNHRFEPAHVMAYGIVQAGLLGNLHTVRICKAHPFGPRCDWQMMLAHGGGQLSVWGPHVIDQALHFLDSPVKSVWSRLARVLTPGDADDHFRLMLLAENGMLGEVEVSNAVALPQPYCVLCGDRGTLRYGDDQRAIELKYLDPEFRMPVLRASGKTPAADYAWTDEVKLPWVEETRAITMRGSVVDMVEDSMAYYLWRALNGMARFPVTSAQALEVVRVTELAKAQNPQFAWPD